MGRLYRCETVLNFNSPLPSERQNLAEGRQRLHFYRLSFIMREFPLRLTTASGSQCDIQFTPTWQAGQHGVRGSIQVQAESLMNTILRPEHHTELEVFRNQCRSLRKEGWFGLCCNWLCTSFHCLLATSASEDQSKSSDQSKTDLKHVLTTFGVSWHFFPPRLFL